MNRDEYRQIYLSSTHWRVFRATTLAERKKCEKCGLSDKCSLIFYRSSLDLHHISYDNLGNEKPTDVQVLCRGCHELAEDSKNPDAHPSFSGYPGLVEFNCPECDEETGVILFYGPSERPKPRFWTRCSCTEAEYGTCVTDHEQEDLSEENATWYIEQHFNAIRKIIREAA